MKKKDVLVKFGNHTRHLAYWLEHHGVGTRDKYDRGVWVSPDMMPKIEAEMRKVPRNATCDRWNMWVSVNTHNEITWGDVVQVLRPDLWEEHRRAEDQRAAAVWARL